MRQTYKKRQKPSGSVEHQWNISGTSRRSPKLERKELVGSSCVIGIWGLPMFVEKICIKRSMHLCIPVVSVMWHPQEVVQSLCGGTLFCRWLSPGKQSENSACGAISQVLLRLLRLLRLRLESSPSHPPTEALSSEVRTAFMPMEKWTPQCHLHFQKLFQQRILAELSPSFRVERCNFALQMGSTKPSLVPREVPRSLVGHGGSTESEDVPLL